MQNRLTKDLTWKAGTQGRQHAAQQRAQQTGESSAGPSPANASSDPGSSRNPSRIAVVCGSLTGAFLLDTLMVEVTGTGEVIPPGQFEQRAGKKGNKWKASLRLAAEPRKQLGTYLVDNNHIQPSKPRKAPSKPGAASNTAAVRRQPGAAGKKAKDSKAARPSAASEMAPSSAAG